MISPKTKVVPDILDQLYYGTHMAQLIMKAIILPVRRLPGDVIEVGFQVGLGWPGPQTHFPKTKHVQPLFYILNYVIFNLNWANSITFSKPDFRKVIMIKNYFFRPTSEGCTILLLYADDIIISGKNTLGIGDLKKYLMKTFQMKGLGVLTYHWSRIQTYSAWHLCPSVQVCQRFTVHGWIHCCKNC